MGLADDISGLLSTQGFAASPIFCGGLPERPDAALSITATQGLGSTHVFGGVAGSPALEDLRCQVMSRAADYQTSESLILSAHAILDGLRQKGMNGRLYQYINGVSAPFFVEWDEEMRAIFSCNYEIRRTLTT